MKKPLEPVVRAASLWLGAYTGIQAYGSTIKKDG